MWISHLSTVYLQVPILATPHDPTSDVVQMAFVEGDGPPSTWVSASWLPNASPPTAMTLVGPANGGTALAPGTYTVWVKIIDNPEVPVVPAPTDLVVV